MNYIISQNEKKTLQIYYILVFASHLWIPSYIFIFFFNIFFSLSQLKLFLMLITGGGRKTKLVLVTTKDFCACLVSV